MTKPADIKIITTEDGSSSLFLPGMNETYHSRHGAVRESLHVFIGEGFDVAGDLFEEIKILEVGFGTGLNAWLTWKKSLETGKKVHYVSLETHPLESEIFTHLNYACEKEEDRGGFLQLHESAWGTDILMPGEKMILRKENQSLQQFQDNKNFNLIYYDAFGPPAQPEMWEKALFEKIAGWTMEGGILVTYCAKGQVRRDLQASGWKVERIPGPPGKREMIRARKENGR